MHSIQYTKYTVYVVFAKCTQSWFHTIYLRVTSLKLSFGQLWASLPITIPDVYYYCWLVHLMYIIFLFKGTEDFYLFLKNKNKAYRKSVSVCSAPYQQKILTQIPSNSLSKGVRVRGAENLTYSFSCVQTKITAEA